MRKLCLLSGLLVALTIPAAFVSAQPPRDSRDARNSGVSDRRPSEHSRDSSASDVGGMAVFIVLAVPQDNSGQDSVVCSNESPRIFFRRTTSGSVGSIQWVVNPAAAEGFQITNCDGTTDGTAEVIVDKARSVRVGIKIVGARTESLASRCLRIVESRGDDLCLIDAETFNKDRSFTKIRSDIFDDEMQDILWTRDISTDFRNAEVRVLDKPDTP